jgi:DNA-binding transcriptional ArsR family regulator
MWDVGPSAARYASYGGWCRRRDRCPDADRKPGALAESLTAPSMRNTFLFGNMANKPRNDSVDKMVQARYRARAQIGKALGHATRLFIIDELSAGEQCVSELQEKIGADMSTVSKHLALLRNAGIVRDERRGTQIYYSLQATCVPRLLRCVENVVKDNARRLVEAAE